MSEAEGPLSLDRAALARLSPLWLRLSPELRVLELSPAATRALGAAALGAPLSAVVTLRRPLRAAGVAELLAGRAQVMLSLPSGGLTLQGLALPWGSGAALLLSPVAESAQALRAAGLLVGDLGPLDPTSAHLMRDQLLRATLNDATQLAAELRVRNDELEALRGEADRARVAAERLAASRADFLSTMSHELRTPLNGVIGTIALLGMQPLDPAAARLQGVLSRSALGLRAIVDDVLDLARLEAGRLELRPAPFALHELLDDVVGEFNGMAEGRGLRLRVEAGEGVGAWLHGDAQRLRQVLSNLVSNAIKFTPAGGVCLRARLRSVAEGPSPCAALWVAVDDSGPGVPEALREAVFDPFRQIDSSARRSAGGTGLGLAICRQLATAMGARLVCGASPEGGARFSLQLELPRASPPLPSLGEGEQRAPTALRLDGLRLLVAEDNLVNQMVAEELLSSRGAQVTLASDGEEALARAAQHDFDVVLMDLMMPRMDGLEATRALLALPGRPAPPVLAMSASVMPADLAACRAAGMCGAVPKPLELDLACALILRALSERLGAG